MIATNMCSNFGGFRLTPPLTTFIALNIDHCSTYDVSWGGWTILTLVVAYFHHFTKSSYQYQCRPQVLIECCLKMQERAKHQFTEKSILEVT